jgi:hypothetical protein
MPHEQHAVRGKDHLSKSDRPRGCKPEPPKILSPKIEPSNYGIQVDHLPIRVEGVVPVQQAGCAATERGQQKAKERDRQAQEQARERKKQSLLSDKQLTLWVDAVRGAPNEIVRSALFTAKNRKQVREDLKQAVVAVIGEGQITYTGEELRQDDETVWLQLIHLARENGLSTAFEFTPYSFCKAINWPINGQSFDRLDKCMTRLQATSLKIASKRLGDEVSLSMLPGYTAKRRKNGGDGGLWRIRMHDELVFLFSEFQYTRGGVAAAPSAAGGPCDMVACLLRLAPRTVRGEGGDAGRWGRPDD